MIRGAACLLLLLATASALRFGAPAVTAGSTCCSASRVAAISPPR